MEIQTIRRRICAFYADSVLVPDVNEAAGSLRADGSFSDVDYTCESRSNWQTSTHLKLTAALAFAFYKTADAEFARLANLSLGYWRAHDFRNSNWWHNDLGVPQLLRKAALLLGECLDAENAAYVLSRLQSEIPSRMTGANKIWFAENVICKGVISQNADLIKKGKDYIEETAFISKRGQEGIQVDYSFAQHGMQLYNHGYGLAYLGNITKWAYLLRNTAFAVNDRIVQMLTDYALSGNMKMCRYHRMDYQAQSREIVRGCVGNSGEMLPYVQILDKLIEIETDAKKMNLLLQARAHIAGRERMPGLEGNSMYYCLDFMTHVKEKYYASVRWASKNVLGGDVCDGTPVNLENLLDGFGAYGACCYMVSGNEYENIFPVWDWGMLPGTTTPHIEMPLEIGAFHESAFVGGVSDGSCGVIAADMHKTYDYNETASFSGKKACFMFENALVHLGCKLQSTAKHDLNTTYNQCLLNGDVYANGEVVKEKCFTDNMASVYHDNIAYYNLDSAELTLDTRVKHGNWHKIYSAEPISCADVKKDIFLLYRPQSKDGDCYAYAVMPGVALEEYKNFEIKDKIEILSNNDVQAVYSATDKKLAAVFYSKGCCSGAGIGVAVDAPCILLYDIEKKVLYISEPEQKYAQICVSVDTGGQSYTASVPMPTALQDKGKTVKYNL